MSQIKALGVRVALTPEVSTTDDLGSIQGSTLRVVDDKEQPEITAFTLCHLFGHLVQLTDRQRYQHLIDPVAAAPPVSLPDSFWLAFYEYEREAFSYGAGLLKPCANDSVEVLKRYSKFMDVDFQHFRKYVSSGTRGGRDVYRLAAQEAFASAEQVEIISPKSLPQVDWTMLPSEAIAII